MQGKSRFNPRNSMSTSHAIHLLPLSAVFVLAACQPLGPNHETPGMNLPASFSQSGVRWEKQTLDTLPKPQAWWKLYKDSTLTSLVERSLENNQELAGASARLRQARAISRSTRTRYFPSIDLSGSANRSKSRISGTNSSTIGNDFSVPADFSYELDIWGKTRREVESAEASEAATAESLNALRLTIAGEVAQTYWALRAVDADRASLARTVELRRKTLSLLTEQRDAGAISGLDLSRADTEVATAEAERIDLEQDRLELVNALAVLAGAAATGSTVPEKTTLPEPPSVPVSVPSELLRQRPDIRSAERTVASANADIGVAIASYYPSVGIGGSGGFSAGSTSDLFKSSALIWSIGPNVSVPIVGQASLRAQRDAAIAAHEAASADYRQTVLNAMREVENALQGSKILVQRQEAQERATASANETFDLSSKRFEAGLVSFLDVVDAERTRLDAERSSNGVRAERLALSVSLIRALGGEW
jgi:outer membrane protein, multidrug efflux system